MVVYLNIRDMKKVSITLFHKKDIFCIYYKKQGQEVERGGKKERKIYVLYNTVCCYRYFSCNHAA